MQRTTFFSRLSRLALPVVAASLLAACGGDTSTSSTTSILPTTFYAHNAVFVNNTTLYTWGNNGAGELGRTTGSALVPGFVLKFANYSAGNGVSLGANHTLAFQKYSTIRAFGYNGYGQLGNGTTTNSTTPVAVRKSRTTASLSGVTAVAAGGYHSLALDRNGNVWGWGNNTLGQLGRGVFTNLSTMTAERVIEEGGLEIAGVTKVAAGGNYSLALLNNGSVWSWGYNALGQLGVGDTVSRFYAVPITSLSGVAQIAAGGGHAMALLNDGTVWAWGYNYYGQVGDGTTLNRLTPVQVVDINNNPLTGITLIAAGLDHSLAYNGATGTLYLWGYNSFGQLGLGDTTTRYKATPMTVTPFLGTTDLPYTRQLFALGHYSRVRKSDGTWWAWGENSSGQLGNNTITNSSTPIRINGL